MNFDNLSQKIISGYVILEKSESPINKIIEVRESIWGNKSLVMGGLIQSGKVVEQIWKSGISAISDRSQTIENCLILGLGAGNAAKLVSRKFPNAKIIGIEIDPVVVDLGKRYFGLNKIKNLEIKIGDATKISNFKFQISNFQLILVDLYLGDKFPEEAEKKEFLTKLGNHLSINGVVIFNRLYYAESAKKEAEHFYRDLQTAFKKVETRKVNWNRLYICRL